MGAPRATSNVADPCGLCRGAGGRLRRRRGGGRRGVLELLLGPEQRVEDLLAQALGEREREPGADDAHQQELADAAAALLLRRLAQGHRGVADRLRRLLEVLLELLVVEQRLRRRLPVAQTT